MSRAKKLAHSLISGYVLLGVNVLYTLASVPLALKYLSTPEFALWGVASTIAQYIALIDFGMAGVSRILIDHKDDRDGGEYGSVIQTFVLVSLVQASLIVGVSIGLAFGLVPVLHIPAAQEREFILLTIGQCAILAGTFVTRILSYLLAAHQRYDIINYWQAFGFFGNLTVLWLAFGKHQGVYSTLWSQLFGWIVCSAAWGWLVLKLKLLPHDGHWGRPSAARFWELFNYGRDIFMLVFGLQLINASQVVLVTRVLGLEAAAVWSICTRTFILLTQVIYRILDYSAPALAEMMVRGEQALLRRRFKSLVVLSTSLAVVAGGTFFVCNQAFVGVWTHGRIGWSPANDALLCAALVMATATRCHMGLIGQAKQIGSMRYIYFVEGLFFVGMSLLVLNQGGVQAMLIVSVIGTLLFSGPYATWRTSRYFDLPWRTVAMEWMLPPLRMAALLAPIVVVTAWVARPLLPVERLVIGALCVGLPGTWLLFRFGLEADLRTELIMRMPGRFRPLLGWFGGIRATAP